MREKIIKALVEEIRKWERIVARKGVDDINDYPLCELFAFVKDSMDCEGCPVCAEIYFPGCVGSPYDAWVEHHEQSHSGLGKEFFEIECYECERLACAQLEFLKGLLSEIKGKEKENEVSKSL